MRLPTSFFVTGFVGAVAAACSSSSSSGGGGASPDAGRDASDATAAACGNIAACYQVKVTVDSTAPAACGSGTTTAVSDYTSITGDGAFLTPDGSCQGQLMNCVMTLTCATATTTASWQLTFTGSGFTGSIDQAPCTATVTGTRLPSCPPPQSTDAGGTDAPAASEASADVEAGPAMDASPDVSSDAPAHDAAAETGPTDAGTMDGGADGPVTDAATDAAQDSGGAEAAAEAGPEGSAPEAAADSSGDDGSGGDAGLDGGPDGGDAGDDVATE